MKEKFSHFNFKEISDGAYFVSNDFGKSLVLDEGSFMKLVIGDITAEADPELWNTLFQNYFILNDDNISEAAEAVRVLKRLNDVQAGKLLVLKVTNFCNYNCIYCQASSDVKNDKTLMTKETAFNAIDMLLSHGVNHITIEYQGGEPLSNFTLIQEVFEHCKELERKGVAQFQHRIMSNLSLLTGEIADYLIRNDICIGTSLDGPKELTDKARMFKNGKGIFDITQGKKDEFEKKLGRQIGLISTVPASTLPHAKEYVNFYIEQDLPYLIRPLFKLGKADKIWDKIGYDADAFLKFYEECLDITIQYCKEHPEAGIFERRSGVFLCSIIYGIKRDIEISSPCGSITEMVSIDWNGDVLACEGSKMIATKERGHFVLGNVNTDDDIDIFYGKNAQALLRTTNSESDPSCSRCAYQPFCGQCEVERYISKDATKMFNCKINEGMLDILVRKLYEDKDGDAAVLRRWAEKTLHEV